MTHASPTRRCNGTRSIGSLRAAIASTIMERAVRPKTVPEGALLLVQLIQKGNAGDALVGHLVAAFEELERRNVGVTVVTNRLVPR